MSTQPVDQSDAPQRLGSYRLHGLLGEGGMGIVHLGVDPSGRAVAVKVLRDHVAHDQVARARLAREVATLRRVDHPSVAPFLGADVEGPRPYIVTRYVPGEALDVWVHEHGPLTGSALREFGITLADALTAIHDAGVIHRDLKPGNVLMPDGSPVVIDFGIAHVTDESRLTSTGLVMGTPGYLAPELLDGQDVSVATDLWGYAATLAFAATGRPPYGTGRTEAVLDRVRRGAADLQGVEPGLAHMLRAALDPDPARRPRLDEMRRFLTDPPASPPPAAPTEAIAEESGRASDAASLAPPTQAVTAPVGDRSSDARPAPTAWWQRPARGASPGLDERHAPRPDDAATAVHPVVSTRVMPAVPAPAAPPVQQPYAGFSAAPSAPTAPADREWSGGGRPPSSGWFAPRGGTPPQRADGWSGPGGAPRSPGNWPAPAPGGPGAMAQPGHGAVAVPRPRPARTGTLIALGSMLVALTAYLPGLGLIVALGWSWLARFVDRLITSVALRRAERGRRDTDLPLAALGSPWHLLGSAVSALVAGILPLLVGAGIIVGLRAVAGDVGGLPVGLPTTIMLGAAAALVVAWWGPGSTTMRRGSRTLVRGVAPGRPGAMIAVAGLLATAVILGLLTQSSGWELSWWPLDGLRRLVPAAVRGLGL